MLFVMVAINKTMDLLRNNKNITDLNFSA